jgi:phage/plasmid-like protein (TIGR03299 family)
MAHYFESGFTVREAAWHGLARTLENAPATAADAIREAGLDWRVDLAPVYADVAGERVPMTDTRATVRTVYSLEGIRVDHLGTVGTGYTPLQNRDAFQWFNPFVESGEASFESAGSLKGGRVVWIMAKLNSLAEASVGTKAGDTVRPYLLLATSHDGTSATRAMFTPVRVVCWNTLSASYSQANASNSRKVRHTRNAADRLAEIRGTIDAARADFSRMADAWAEMSRYRLPESPAARAEIVRAYARLTFGTEADAKRAIAEGPRAVAELPEVRCEKDLWRLLHRGPGADSAGATAFGLLQAATHFIDHEQGRNADSRLSSSWQGIGANYRQRATDRALALIGAGGGL